MAGTIRPLTPILVTLSVLCAVATGAYYGHRWLVTSERFAVSEIQVRGNQRLNDDHVRAALGAATGENIFQLNLSTLAHNLEMDPWIEHARVERRLPDKLRITVKERVAAAIVDLGGLYLADSTGHIFKRATIQAGEGRGLPVVTGLARKGYLKTPKDTYRRIREALDIAHAYGQTAGRPALGEIRLDVQRGATLFTYDTALAIRLGHGKATDLTARMTSFDSAWRALTPDERRTATRIHVDNPARANRITVAFAPAH